MNIKLKCMKESIFVTLQKCTVFEGFTPEEIREALSMVSYRMVELAARETYVLAGMPCRYADIIVEGEMIARMSGLSGKQAQIERLGESMLIAPAYIFAHHNEMPVSVETSKKTTLLRMRPSELKLLIDTDERIRWNFIQHLSRIDIFLSQKMRMLSLFSVKEKVAQYLIKIATEQQSRTIIWMSADRKWQISSVSRSSRSSAASPNSRRRVPSELRARPSPYSTRMT